VKRLLVVCLLLQAGAWPILVAQGATPHGILIRDLRIDGYAADLSRVSYVAVARDGTIIVDQPQDATILYFAPDGHLLGRFGRRGAGPGEFKLLARLGWVGDTLWAFDMQLMRLTLIFPPRQLLRTVRVPTSITPPRPATGPVPKLRSPEGGALLPGGDVLVDAFVYRAQQPKPFDKEFLNKDGVYVRVSPEGTYRHLLLAYSVFGEQCKWEHVLDIPQCPPPLRDFADDGGTLVTLETSVAGPDRNNYRVSLMRITGDTLFSRRYAFVGMPISKRVVDSIRARMLSQATAAELRSAIRTVPFPSVYPPVKQLRVGRDGTTWIGLRPTAEGRPWIILDATGNKIGEVLLPPAVVLWVADRNTIWGVEWDADDMPSIVRYQISWRH
jgi:hypothetical protein